MKLSVVVPCYNVAEQLPTLFRSLQGNLRSDFEFIFVEDGSTDETPATLDALAAELPGARLLRHRANRGLSAARNAGVKAARGTYLTWLDADDWIGPDHLEHLVHAIERFGCDFVRTDHIRVTGRRRTVVRSPEPRRDLVIAPRTAIGPPFRATSVDYAMAWAGIYHRRLAERGLLSFAEQLRAGADRHWYWRLHRESDSFAVVGLLGVFHRHGVAGSLNELRGPSHLHFLEAMLLVLAETAADRDAELLLPKAVDATCALISHQVAKRGRLSPDLQRELIERAVRALDSMPARVLDRVLAEGSPRRRALLTRLRRDPASLCAVA